MKKLLMGISYFLKRSLDVLAGLVNIILLIMGTNSAYIDRTSGL